MSNERRMLEEAREKQIELMKRYAKERKKKKKK